MTRTDETLTMTSGEFAHLGEGSVAYLRKVSSDDLRRSSLETFLR